MTNYMQCWHCTSQCCLYSHPLLYISLLFHLPSLPGSVWSPSSGDRPSTKEWVLMGVVDSSQLGSVQRLREKMVNMQQSAIREVEPGRQALQEAQPQQALDQRVQDAEEKVQNLQTQLETSQDVCQELWQSLRASQQSLQRTQADKQCLERALQELQLSERALQERVTTAEQSTQEVREQMQVLQQRVQEAEQRGVEAERRGHEAQQRASEGPGEGEPLWLVDREEINLTEEELGRGGWGVVKVATFHGARIAAKCLYGALNYGYWQNVFSREMNMAARIRHPNLLQFIGATLEGEMIILTELMPTSLRAVLERAREPCTSSPADIHHWPI